MKSAILAVALLFSVAVFAKDCPTGNCQVKATDGKTAVCESKAEGKKGECKKEAKACKKDPKACKRAGKKCPKADGKCPEGKAKCQKADGKCPKADGTGPKAEGKAQCKRVRKGPRPATVTPAAATVPAVEVVAAHEF
ncbi:MAG: hypothetical protein RSA59_05740 [Raoultibacter sp.]